MTDAQFILTIRQITPVRLIWRAQSVRTRSKVTL